MSVVRALTVELAQMPDGVGDGSLAAQALVMAAQLDDPNVSATAKSMCSKDLRETMAALHALAPPKVEEDEIERARKRRAARLEGTPAAWASTPS